MKSRTLSRKVKRADKLGSGEHFPGTRSDASTGHFKVVSKSHEYPWDQTKPLVQRLKVRDVKFQ